MVVVCELTMFVSNKYHLVSKNWNLFKNSLLKTKTTGESIQNSNFLGINNNSHMIIALLSVSPIENNSIEWVSDE